MTFRTANNNCIYDNFNIIRTIINAIEGSYCILTRCRQGGNGTLTRS